MQGEAHDLNVGGHFRIRSVTQAAAAERSPTLVSCVMPTFGRPAFVPEAVKMFLDQDYIHKELVIVNECPGQAFECDSPGVRVFNTNQKFLTLGDARNFAVSKAHGEIIVVWDDDDVHLPWRIAYSVRQMQRLGVAVYRPSAYWAYWGEGPLHHNLASLNWMHHGMTAFTKDIWRCVGGYPSKNVREDTGFIERIHEYETSDFEARPLAVHDRFYILRGWSRYAHMSMGGGVSPLDLSPGNYQVAPAEIADDRLRAHVERLVEARRRRVSAIEPGPVRTAVAAAKAPARPAISVCIAVQNQSRVVVAGDVLEFLPQAVIAIADAALELRTEGGIELVLVDFSSTDWPLSDWVRQAAGQVSLKLTRVNPTFSLPRAVDLALAEATSDRILISRPEILIASAALERAIEVIDAGKVWAPTYCSLTRDGEIDGGFAEARGLVGAPKAVVKAARGFPDDCGWLHSDLFSEWLAFYAPLVQEATPLLQRQWQPPGYRETVRGLARRPDVEGDFPRDIARRFPTAPIRRALGKHPHWTGEVLFFHNRRMTRLGLDWGAYELVAERLTLFWDRWDAETLWWDEAAGEFRDHSKGFSILFYD